MAATPSPAASITLDKAGALLVSQAKALGGGEPVTAVAHSMGGTVLTRAVQDAPQLFARAVYLCAFMPPAGLPAADYLFMPENEGDLAAASLVADPAQTGGLRMGPCLP